MMDDNEGLGGPATARHDDPVSSHLAAAEVEKTGKAQTDRIWALAAVHKYPGLTARELARELNFREPGCIERHAAYEKLHRRLPELRMVDLVRSEVIEPPCTVTKRMMQRWWYNGSSS